MDVQGFGVSWTQGNYMDTENAENAQNSKSLPEIRSGKIKLDLNT